MPCTCSIPECLKPREPEPETEKGESAAAHTRDVWRDHSSPALSLRRHAECVLSSSVRTPGQAARPEDLEFKLLMRPFLWKAGQEAQTPLPKGPLGGFQPPKCLTGLLPPVRQQKLISRTSHEGQVTNRRGSLRLELAILACMEPPSRRKSR